jgi:PKD repeat protein
MNNTITSLNPRAGRKTLWMLLLGLFLLQSWSIQAQNRTRFSPWCQAITYHWNAASTYWYSAIEQVTLELDGDPIFNKAPDGLEPDPNYAGGFGNFGKVLNTPNTPIELVAGGTYTMKVSLSSYVGYSVLYWNLFIDYNQDYIFQADNVERMANTGVTTQVPSTARGEPGNQTEIKFTVPCDAKEGLTRMRILDAINAANTSSAAMVCQDANNQYRYGEAEDIYIFISRPTRLVADFSIPSIIWAGAPTTIFNRFPREGAYSWDKGSGIDFRGDNYLTVFPRGGNFDVTLINNNCLGTTSITKRVFVTDIPQRPEADFVASRNRIIEGDEIMLYDLTQYGPFQWDWEVDDFEQPNFKLTNKEIRRGRAFNGSFFNAVFGFDLVGEFNVSLTSTNMQGQNKKSKLDYIVVEEFSDFLLGVGATQTELGSGRILDGGGTDENYPSGPLLGAPSRNRLLIKPCGAERISLTIEKLTLGNNAHSFRVYDGEDNKGKALHADSGFNSNNILLPTTVVATSGSMFIEFDAVATGTGEGIIAHFNTVFGQTNAPAPFFEQTFPSQAYTGSEVFFKGGVNNLFGLNTVKWTVDRFEVPSSFIRGDQMAYTFNQPGTYNVCLEVKSCAGDSSFCRSIQVTDPVGRTSLDFVPSDDRPELSQNVELRAITDKANRFQWNIVPASFSINSGSLRAKYPNVSFNRPGTYSVSLRAWNTFDSAGSTRFLVKNNYIIVIDPCTPLAFESSDDVTNNRLRVFDRHNQQIFSHTSSGGNSYRSFLLAGDPIINLTFGATYDIEMFRNTARDTVSRSIFIDFNSNGVFEPSEMVLFERNTLTNEARARFKVPSIFDAYNGTTRLRTVVTYGESDPLNPCGPGLLAEYKDYRVSLNQSSVLPVITLIGKDTIELEVGTPYTDAGATAFDAIDGDITADLVVEDNIDVNQPGIYFTRYDVANSSGVNARSAIRQVLVFADRTAPVLSLNGAAIDTIEVNTLPYVDPMGIAIDNIDGDISSEIQVIGTVDHTEIGLYHLLYEVRDVQGNLASATRTVHVLDRTAPEFHFTTGTQLQLGQFWYDQTSVTDNYWPSSTINFAILFGSNGPVRWDVAGQYPITYRAIDGSGNVNEVTRLYEVGDFVAPTIVLNTPDNIIHDVNTPYFRTEPLIFDNFDAFEDLVITVTSNVDPNVLGTYEERYQVTDRSGNISEKSRFVTVVDRVAPLISGAHICTELLKEFNPMHGLIITDNYYSEDELLPLVEVVSSNVNIFFNGMYFIVYQVTDPSGNKSNFLSRNIEISENCELITSVRDVHAAVEFDLYPVPTKDIVTLSFGKLSQSIQKVEIFNSIGELVSVVPSHEVMNGMRVDMSSHAAGVYTFKISGEQISASKRAVIIK